MKNKEIGIYIHIPFCKHKCFYCDFISYCNKDNFINSYIKALKKEIQLKEINSEITTVYIGGGTPSYIDSEYIKEIINEIKLKNVSKKAEITIEVNPGTVNRKKLEDYKKCGINRLSIGLQTANNTLLQQIGRIHNFEQFLETYNLAKQVGLDNINVDLMLGLPNQKIEDLKSSLKKVIDLEPTHISVYSLILEDGTVLSDEIAKGNLKLPDDEYERNMYWYVKNTLELNGYKHYEISNFAKNNYESKHNLNCWKQYEYIGFGASAHSYENNTRYSNVENLQEYIKNVENDNIEKNRIIHEIQKEADKKKEFMLLGLRMIDGIKISDFKNKFGDNPIYLFRNELDKLVNENLIVVDSDVIKLTNKGIDLANLVWEEFV